MLESASLYLGRREGDRLLYAGKAQTGFAVDEMREIRERLDPFIIRHAPLDQPIKKPKATWVRPVVRAEVTYGGVTEDGLLREPVFKGLRDDLSEPEPASPATVQPSSGAPGVSKENILQLLPGAPVPSKEQLATYWTKVWRKALKYLGRRPLKLVRHVHGTTFYHKGRGQPKTPVMMTAVCAYCSGVRSLAADRSSVSGSMPVSLAPLPHVIRWSPSPPISPSGLR